MPTESYVKRASLVQTVQVPHHIAYGQHRGIAGFASTESPREPLHKTTAAPLGILRRMQETIKMHLRQPDGKILFNITGNDDNVVSPK